MQTSTHILYQIFLQKFVCHYSLALQRSLAGEHDMA
jgi:hypothetical protein